MISFIVVLYCIHSYCYNAAVALTGGNNACATFQDYFTASNNKNCFYNPDMFLETPDLIRKYTGQLETYEVKTEDGYILTMFRIPRQNPRDVILLQHPLTVNSRIWVGQGNDSLAFLLWNKGYDIWLNNARGTLFSERHETLNFRETAYWNYSFHEIGYYDISTQIRFIKNKTKKSKILYVGHSLGGTSGLIYASLRPREAEDSVKAFAFMALPAYYKHMTSPYKLLAPYAPYITDLALDVLHLANFFPLLPITQIMSTLSRLFPLMPQITNMVITLTSGWTPEEIDPTILNFDSAIYLKNFSFKSFLHYLQLVRSETRFQMFDYGRAKNLQMYKSEVPPRYPLENISVPIFIIASANDSLTTLQDSDLVYESLPERAKIYKPVKVYGLNHVDYMIGRHRNEIWFQKLFAFLDNLDKEK